MYQQAGKKRVFLSYRHVCKSAQTGLLCSPGESCWLQSVKGGSDIDWVGPCLELPCLKVQEANDAFDVESALQGCDWLAEGVPVSPVFPDTSPASCSLWAALIW